MPAWFQVTAEWLAALLLCCRLAKEQRWLGEGKEGPMLSLQGYSRILACLAALEVAPSKVWLQLAASACSLVCDAGVRHRQGLGV